MMKNVNSFFREGAKILNRIQKRIAIGSELEKLIRGCGKAAVDNAILGEIELYTSCEEELSSLFPFMPEEIEDNGTIYKALQNYTAQDVLNQDVDFEELANYILDFFGDNDDVDTSDFADELDDYVNNDIYRQYEEQFNKDVEEYIKNNLYCGGVNDNGTYYNTESGTLSGKEAPDEFEHEDVSIDDIPTLDDSVGQSSRIDDIIDVDNRDNAFVYIDGEVIEGDVNETHSQILNRFCEEHDIEEPDNGIGNDITRPNIDEVEHKLDTSKIAFGHFVNDIAFIEVCEGCSAADVVAALEDEFEPEKIYFYDREEDYITRLAKVIDDKNMQYADTKNKKYPCYDEEHIRAAWNYIHVKRDANEYSDEEYKKVYNNIVKYWKKKIDPAGPPEYQEEKVDK